MSENPADQLEEAASVLEFLSEALSKLASPNLGDSGLSAHAVDGLAFICIYLHGLCREAGNKP